MNAINVPDDPGPFSELKTDGRGLRRAGPGPFGLGPDNVPISEHHAWLTDWAWPTLGAAWTDPALLGTPRPHGIRRRPGPLHKARPRARPLVNLAFGIDKMNET